MKPHPVPRHRPTPRLLACALASCLALAAPAALAQSTVGHDPRPGHGRLGAGRRSPGHRDQRRHRPDSHGPGRQRQLQRRRPAAGHLSHRRGRSKARPPRRTVTLQVGQTATVEPGGRRRRRDRPGRRCDDGRHGHRHRRGWCRRSRPRKSRPTSPPSRSNRCRRARATSSPSPTSSRACSSRPATRARPACQSGAQSANGINVYIDGVGQKNYVLQGGISGQDSSRGNPFPQSAIGEYKVITQNYKAEYDQLSSAAIIATTRSGTQRVRRQLLLGPHRDRLARPRPCSRSATDDKIQTQEDAVRRDLRRPDPARPGAFLPLLRGQGDRVAAHVHARAWLHPRPAAAGNPAAGRLRPALGAVQGGPVLRQDRLADRREPLLRADRQVPRRERDHQRRRAATCRATRPTSSTTKPAPTCATSTPTATGSTTRT